MEETLDLSFDRLLMMMMMYIYVCMYVCTRVGMCVCKYTPVMYVGMYECNLVTRFIAIVAAVLEVKGVFKREREREGGGLRTRHQGFFCPFQKRSQ